MGESSESRAWDSWMRRAWVGESRRMKCREWSLLSRLELQDGRKELEDERREQESMSKGGKHLQE